MMSVGKRWRWLLAVPLLLIPVLVYAQTIPALHTFAMNSVISSAQVNENFQNLDGRMKVLEAGIPWTKITGVPVSIKANDGNINIGGNINRTLFGGNSAGNIHIDADSDANGAPIPNVDGHIYLNFYTGHGVVFGNGKGTATTVALMDDAGNLLLHGTTSPMSLDVAENIPTSDASVEPGDVVSMARNEEERIVRARSPHDLAVLGVISTRPGVLLSGTEPDAKPDPSHRAVALVGRVPVKVTLEGGAIEPGDLLTSSSTPGHAMKAQEPWRGGIIGVAMTRFHGKGSHSGRVIVFLNLRPAPSVDPRVVDELRATNRDLQEQLKRIGDLDARIRAAEKQLATRIPSEASKLAKTVAP